MFTSHLLLDYINECSSEGSSFLLYDGTHALYIDYDDLTGSSIYIGPLVQFLKFLSPFQKNFKTNGTSIESTNKGLLDS